MSTQTPAQVLATAILAAMKIREDSYDKTAADEAHRVDQARIERLKRENPDNRYIFPSVDYATFYTKTMQQAAEEASKELGFPVYLLAHYSWNDAQDWARQTLGMPPIESQPLTEMFDELAAIPGNGWKEMEDPIAELAKEREK